MNFKNYISDIKDEKIIKALNKPIPKKIVSSFEGASLSAADIASLISFPKEKIYYHIKKLVALEVLYIAETKEIKGILQKKYKLKSFANDIDIKKNDYLKYRDRVGEDIDFQDLVTNKNASDNTSSRFEYYIAVAGNFLRKGPSNELKIESFKLQSKRKKLKNSIAKIKIQLQNIIEKTDVTIVQISLYDDIELLQNKLKEKIIENNKTAKEISRNNNLITSLKEKVFIIDKNYNDEKNKKKLLIQSIIETINQNERDLLIQSKKSDQVESYMENVFGGDIFLKKFENFDFKSKLSELKIKKRKIKKENLITQSDIELVDSKITKNEKAIELLVHENIFNNHELIHLEGQFKLFNPISEKVKNNNLILKSNLDNELLDLENYKNNCSDEADSLNLKINSSKNRTAILEKSLIPLKKDLFKNKNKHHEILKKRNSLLLKLETVRKQKEALQSSLANDNKEKTIMLFDLKKVIKKIKGSSISEDIKKHTITKKTYKREIKNLEIKIILIDEQIYQDTSFFEKTKKLLKNEKNKQLQHVNLCEQKALWYESTIQPLNDEIESYKHLHNLHGVLLRTLKLFDSNLFQLDFDNSVIEKNNIDRSFEISIDGYINTFNWSINDLKSNTRNFMFEKIQNKKGSRSSKQKQIFKEAKKILEVSRVVLSLPEKLKQVKTNLHSLRIDKKEIIKLRTEFKLQKIEISKKREKKISLKKIIKTYEEKLKDIFISIGKRETKEEIIEQKIKKHIQIINKIKENLEYLTNKEIEEEFEYDRDRKDLKIKIVELESTTIKLKESIIYIMNIEIEKDKKIRYLEKFISLVEKENDISNALDHNIEIIGLKVNSILDQKNKSIEDLRLNIEIYENEIISKKTQISSSRFEEKQVLQEVRIWKKEIGRLSAEKRLIMKEIDKEKSMAEELELRLNFERDKVVQKIEQELNKEAEKENSRKKKIYQIYNKDIAEQKGLEKKVLSILKIEEKKILSISKSLNKIDIKIKNFTTSKNLKIRQSEKRIENLMLSKEKFGSRIILENQALQASLFDNEELQNIMKDKIIAAGLKIQKLDKIIKFKSSEEYYFFNDQTINAKDGAKVGTSQINELINKSLMKDRKKIISIRQELSFHKKDHFSKFERNKKSIITLKNKIAALKKQQSECSLELKINSKTHNKMVTPLNNFEKEKQHVLNEKDILEKSYIQIQLNEQNKLDEIIRNRNRIESNYQNNLKKFKEMFISKQNEFLKRIKSQEDIRNLKINQSSKYFHNILEKTGKRLSQIEQLIFTGEEVIKESEINLEDILKMRNDASVSIKINDKKVYTLDQKLESLKVKLDLKIRSLNKKNDGLKLRIDKSNNKKFEFQDKKEAIELDLKSLNTTVFNFGQDPSQVQYHIAQNEDLIKRLKEEKNKRKSEFISTKNKMTHNTKELNDSLEKHEKTLKISIEKSIILKNEKSDFIDIKKELENSCVISKDDLIDNNQKLFEYQKSFKNLENDLRYQENKYKSSFNHNEKVLKALSNKYQYLVSYSKEINNDEKLISGYVNTIILERNKNLEALNIRKVELGKLIKELEKLDIEITSNKRNFDEDLYKINDNKSSFENEKSSLSEKLKLIKTEIFDIKVLRKSDDKQLKIFSERENNLNLQLKNISSSFEQEISSYSNIIKLIEADLIKAEMTLKRCDHRIQSLNTSIGPRNSELEKIQESIKTSQSMYSDLQIEQKSLNLKIEDCKKGLRKTVKLIKSDSKRLEQEGEQSEHDIMNLKLSLDQNIKSTKTQRKELEKNIRYRSSLKEVLNESIDELRTIDENISNFNNKLNSAKDLKKLLSEKNTLDQIISTLNLKIEQSHEDFKSLNSVISELKETKNQRLEPVEKEIIEREFNLLKSKDVIRQNNQLVNEYEERMKIAPNKIKTLNSTYLEHTRLKFQLDLQLKDRLRNLELLDKKASVFNSSNF